MKINCFHLIVTALLSLLILNHQLIAQPIIEWEKNFGGTGWDSATTIDQTSDGGFIVAGESRSNDGDVGSNSGCLLYTSPSPRDS